MAKTGLFGFGYINESIFYSKLSDLLGRDVTAQDKQLIHNTVQRQLEDGCLEYYACDGQGTVSVSSSAPRSAKAILAKSVFTGLHDRQNQQILAYVCQQAGGKWSSVYVGARPAVFGIVSSYHIGYLNFRNFAQANDFICALHEVLLPGEQWSFPRSEENPALLRRSTKYQILESYLRHTFAKLMLEYKTPGSDNYGKIVFTRACSEPSPDYPRWNRKRIEDTVWKMLMENYLECDDLLDPVIPFAESAEGFMKYVDQHPELSIKMGVEF